MALGSYNESLLSGASTSFEQVKKWLAGNVGTQSLPAKPRIDDVDRLTVDNEDTTTGNALSVSSTITTSTVVSVTGSSLTTGGLVSLTSAGTGNDLAINNTNTGALGPKVELYHNPGNSQAADDDVVGRILFAADDEEAAATKRTVGQFDIQWTDATAASYASDLELYLATSAASNLCLTLTGGGQMGLDLDSDLSASSAAGQIFDDYDDAAVLKRYAYLGVDEPKLSLETVKQLEAMGIVEANSHNQRGYMLKLQPFLRLICGGIYQLAERLDEGLAQVRREILALEAA